MKLKYWIKNTNFGDQLNKYLWNKYLDKFLQKEDNFILLGIGTLLGEYENYLNNVIVCGSGLGYGNKINSSYYKNWKFFFVRGPLTAKVLNLREDTVVTDPAILSSELFSNFSNQKKNQKIFIPHFENANNPFLKEACKAFNIKFVSPLNSVEFVIKQIASSQLVLAEAMHGAIIADSFRVPWVPISLSTRVNDFKWQDWSESMNLDINLNKIKLFGLHNRVMNLSKGWQNYFQSNGIVNSNSNFVEHFIKHFKSFLPININQKIFQLLIKNSLKLDNQISFFVNSEKNKYLLDKFFNKFYYMSNQLGHLSEEKVFNSKKLMCIEKINDVKNYLELN